MLNVYCAISPNSPPTFYGGGQKLAHTRLNLGPRDISETITDRKLKFYRHIDRSKYSFMAWKFRHVRGVRRCKFETPSYLGNY